MSERKKNPWTGMDMAKEPTGNGEVVKVEDLVNKPYPEWEQYEPVDTLTNADTELTNLYDRLSDEPELISSQPEVISVEELMNSDQKSWTVREKPDAILDGNIEAQIGNKTQQWELLNSKKSPDTKYDDLSLKSDNLIQSLTGVLG